MKLKEYHELAMRTAKVMNNKMDQLVHGGMGAASEPGELALTALNYLNDSSRLDRANILEELGDGMWFAAYCTDTLGMTLPELEPLIASPVMIIGDSVPLVAFASSVLLFCHLGGEVATHIKAHAFYGKPLDKAKLAETLKAYIEAIAAIGGIVGYELSPILEYNIAKLRNRYPGKYSDEAAIARADKAVEAAPVTNCGLTPNPVFTSGHADAMPAADNTDRRFFAIEASQKELVDMAAIKEAISTLPSGVAVDAEKNGAGRIVIDEVSNFVASCEVVKAKIKQQAALAEEREKRLALIADSAAGAERKEPRHDSDCSIAPATYDPI